MLGRAQERSKEHQADRNSMLEESHQVKHWLIHHQEMQCPPAFRYKVIASFKDPMTRQLSEAVRIELRGSGILNSKSEYSRCRVPRLKVDMEGWNKTKSREDPNKAEANQIVEAESSFWRIETGRERMLRKMERLITFKTPQKEQKEGSWKLW